GAPPHVRGDADEPAPALVGELLRERDGQRRDGVTDGVRRAVAAGAQRAGVLVDPRAHVVQVPPQDLREQSVLGAEVIVHRGVVAHLGERVELPQTHIPHAGLGVELLARRDQPLRCGFLRHRTPLENSIDILTDFINMTDITQRPEAPMVLPAGIDFTDASVYEDGLPHDLFGRLRAASPVWWNPQPPETGGFDDEGFWVVSTNDLVREVSRDGALFSSWENTALTRYADDTPRAMIDANRALMLNMDAPEHTTLRSIISRGFTPRAIATLRAGLAGRAADIVAAACESGSGDFVEQV